MQLYVARHGAAGLAHDDNLRELTDEGAAITRNVYSRCAELIRKPIATVISSPLVRARQTADIALINLPVATRDIAIAPELRPESVPEAIARILDGQTQWPVLLVGHQPILGEFLCWLTDQEHYRHGVATSSLFALDLITPARGCGTLLWQS